MSSIDINNEIGRHENEISVPSSNTALPRISVVMPTLNAARYLREAVDSILAQTFTDFEFLIVDDNSTDETLDILNSYNDSRIRLIQGPQKGIAAAINCGIREARGTYIARMDADDISFPNRFLMQIEFMDSHPDIGICGSQSISFSNDGNKTVWSPVENPHIFDILMDAAFCHPTVFFRKSCLEKYNLFYNENFSCAEDQELWFRAIKFTKFYNIQEVLLMYRNHKYNKSKITANNGESVLCNLRKEFMDWLGIKCTNKNVNDTIINLLLHLKKNQSITQTGIYSHSKCGSYKKRYYLFGKIPVWKTKKTDTRIEFYLFGFICVLKIRIIYIN